MLVVFVRLVFLLVFPAYCQAEAMKTYDATLGTLPDAQGWELQERTPSSPPCTIQGDGMHQGLTTWSGFQTWHSFDVPFNFTEDYVFMEAELKVISSSYDPFPRAGYGLVMADALERLFAVQIAGDRIFITNSVQSGTETRAFDSTDDFHHYRFVVTDASGKLYIDADPIPFLSLAVGSPWPSGADNGAFFGDATALGQSETLLRSFAFGVPEPSTLILLATGTLGLLAYVWRRRR